MTRVFLATQDDLDTKARRAPEWFGPGMELIDLEVVTRNGVIYQCNTAHTTTGSFDSPKFDVLSGAGGGGSGVVPMDAGDIGSTLTVDMDNEDTVYVVGRLTAATCAVTITNMPPGFLAQCIFHLQQDATGGRKVTFAQTVKWIPGSAIATNGVPPVILTPASAVTEFAVYSSDGGTNKFGRHGQPIRSHSFHYNGALSAGAGVDAEMFLCDARVVKVVPFVGTVPSGSASTFDMNLGSLAAGVGSTMYTVATKPSVAVGQRTNTSVALPDIVDIPPNGIVSVDVDAANSAANLTFTFWTVEAE